VNGLLLGPPAGYRFPHEVIAVAVRWYLRYGLSYRDVERSCWPSAASRSITWRSTGGCRPFTPAYIDAARSARHVPGSRWFVDETYVKAAGRWIYLYRPVDQHRQVIDVMVSARRNADAARAFFTRALHQAPAPVEVTTDRAPVYSRVLEQVACSARHVTEQHANNDRSRPRTTQSPAAADARTQMRPVPYRLSRPVTRSCRTFAAATTNSPSTTTRTSRPASRSTN
jgi:transposase-like protein